MRLLFRAFQLSFGLATKPLAESPSERSLSDIWRALHEKFFAEHAVLKEYKLTWSTRKHRRTLASCNVARKRISVAPVMKLPEAAQHLEALLFHEMCHAVLGKPKRVNGRRQIHGREFKLLERLHPEIPALDRWIASGGWYAAARKYNRANRSKRGSLNG